MFLWSSVIFVIFALSFVYIVYHVRRSVKVSVRYSPEPDSNVPQRNSGQSLLADVSIGLVLGIVILVSIVSIVYNEAQDDTNKDNKDQHDLDEKEKQVY